MFLGAPVNFCFELSPPSMRKVNNGGEKIVTKKIRMIMEIVATNIVASRPHKRQPTGTPTTRAKSDLTILFLLLGFR